MKNKRLKRIIENSVFSVLLEDQQSSWDWEEFKSISDLKEMIAYASQRLRSVGEGSSRIVFMFDQDKVIKIALNDSGIAQNKAERNVCGEHPELFTKIYASDKRRNKWILAQYASGVNRSEFEALSGVNYDDFVNILSDISTMHEALVYRNMYKDSNKFLFVVLDVLSKCEYEVGDFMKLDSWGEIDSENRLVLVDYGLTIKSFKKYYANNNSVYGMTRKPS